MFTVLGPGPARRPVPVAERPAFVCHRFPVGSTPITVGRSLRFSPHCPDRARRFPHTAHRRRSPPDSAFPTSPEGPRRDNDSRQSGSARVGPAAAAHRAAGAMISSRIREALDAPNIPFWVPCGGTSGELGNGAPPSGLGPAWPQAIGGFGRRIAGCPQRSSVAAFPAGAFCPQASRR